MAFGWDKKNKRVVACDGDGEVALPALSALDVMKNPSRARIKADLLPAMCATIVELCEREAARAPILSEERELIMTTLACALTAVFPPASPQSYPGSVRSCVVEGGFDFFLTPLVTARRPQIQRINVLEGPTPGTKKIEIRFET